MSEWGTSFLDRKAVESWITRPRKVVSSRILEAKSAADNRQRAKARLAPCTAGRLSCRALNTTLVNLHPSRKSDHSEHFAILDITVASATRRTLIHSRYPPSSRWLRHGTKRVKPQNQPTKCSAYRPIRPSPTLESTLALHIHFSRPRVPRYLKHLRRADTVV
jgi:hypothetical protein